ncbi:RagB/SusD family nutrient uptake outer membrane protein [Algoriphagus sp. AGSA1]|uniref:RagB/SusD family nutrient uptake outer membrane protein n=1 Tax=unclassified Algoriphagus TaxID=2641541 RepID=UPI001CE07C3C|nr:MULTISPECIES: RagB/SusD family nutrient uptake outer membrane protein [unclassified Algoriphagus]MCE7056252.1 RagB/SusD family nutrient uptake outer membrane protein [Algoriphagus sp. AGSA1]
MNNILKYKLVGALLMMGLSACNSDFLDLAPISQENSTNFYKTASDMENALTAVYGSLQYGGTYYSSMHIIGELRSDNTEITNPNAGANLQAVDDFTNDAVNSISSTTWNAHYQGIQAANIVIDKIATVEMDATLKTRYVGEAKFLRALLYFNLVRIYGDVPLVLQMISSPEQGYTFGRNPKEEVYTQIITDLNDAEASLPFTYSSAEAGRATKGAAMTLLAKIYLTRKEWTEASQKLKEVIDASGQTGYRLMDSYGDIFGPTNENNAESIFEVQFSSSSNGEGSPFTNQFAPIGSGTAVVSVGNPLGQNIPTEDMNAAYSVGDARKELSMATSYQLNGNEVAHNYILKYSGTPAAYLDSDNNWIVLRYADVLLMYAEALNEISFQPDGEAFLLLNQIRSRAGLPMMSSSGPVPAYVLATQQDFRAAVANERRVELAFEGHRWFDLVRTDEALNVLSSKGIQAHNLLFPIPQSQIDINPGLIVQNPGY